MTGKALVARIIQKKEEKGEKTRQKKFTCSLCGRVLTKDTHNTMLDIIKTHGNYHNLPLLAIHSNSTAKHSKQVLITRALDSIERRGASRLGRHGTAVSNQRESNQARVLGTDETSIKEFPEGSENNEEVPSSSSPHPENLTTLTEEDKEPMQSEPLTIVKEDKGAINIKTTTDSSVNIPVESEKCKKKGNTRSQAKEKAAKETKEGAKTSPEETSSTPLNATGNLPGNHHQDS